MMKVVVSDKFYHLREWVNGIAYTNTLPDGDFLHDGRNRIVRITVNGEDVVVKQFHRPNPVNMVAYSFFRRSKAERAYYNAEHLRAMGYDSPEPIAYIELKKYALFTTGYYICRYSPYPTVCSISGEDRQYSDEIIAALACFTARMHNDGIYFYDYNAGNILYSHEDSGKWNFSLIDVNRIWFKRKALNLKKSTDVLRRLYLEIDLQFVFLRQYARFRGWNEKIVVGTTFLKQGVNLNIRMRNLYKRVFRRKRV